MNVLLTNDDGYQAPGMASLLDAVETLGWTPIVVAPQSVRTGAARSRVSGKVMHWSESALKGARCISLDGTPAACVLFALTAGVLPHFDLCISGINAGENLGAGLSISGTFGAAAEAQALGTPAIALSREYENGDINSNPEGWDWSSTSTAAAEILAWCLKQVSWRLINVSIPNGATTDHISKTRISRESYFRDRYDVHTSTIVSSVGFNPTLLTPDDDITAFAIERRVSASFLTSDLP